jgi:predicted MFS family arabinose efflux permease
MTTLINALRGRGATAGRGDADGIVVLVRTLLLFESAMWSAVTPVLPHYQHSLHASTPAVGLLAASYPAGMVPGSLLGAWLATRSGVRRPTLIGLLLFTVSIGAFGFGTDIGTLDALRFIQGIGCGFIWGGGLTWAVAVADRDRRGAVLGSVFGAAILGSLLGPILGTLAVWAGTRVVFLAVGAIAFGLTIWTAGHPEPALEAPGPHASLRTLPGNPLVRLGFWLILLEAGALGAIGTLIPLRLSRFGASGTFIGVTFLVSALLSRQVSTPVGRLVDRRGAGTALRLGLATASVLAALLIVPQSAVMLAIVSVVLVGGPLAVYMVPAMSMITHATERAGIPLAVATLMLNLAWAAGETGGAPIAASLSQLAGDTLPFLALAGLMALTLVPVIRTRLPAPPGDRDQVPDDRGPGTATTQTGSSVTSRATSAA